MSRTSRIRVVALVAATVAVAVVAIASSWSGPPGRSFWFLLAACVVGEGMWLRLPSGGATLSMASCFNLAAALVLPRGEAAAATALACLLAELVAMRKPPLRAGFNAAHTAISVVAAAWAFDALAGGSRELAALLAGGVLHPFAAAVATYYVINRTAVSLAVALSEDIPPQQAWQRNFGTGHEALSSAAVFSLGVLLAILYLEVGAMATMLVLFPLVLARESLRRSLAFTTGAELEAGRRAA